MLTLIKIKLNINKLKLTLNELLQSKHYIIYNRLFK